MLCTNLAFRAYYHDLSGAVMHELQCMELLKMLMVKDVAYSIGLVLGKAFVCCILLRIYLTDSLCRRQSQQSFNTLTPFNFLFYSLHVSTPKGYPQVRYTISYYFCF
jgi:hypothetical protein